MKPSGKFVLRIDPDLHQRLKDEADRRALSLNKLILSRLLGKVRNEIIQPILDAFGSDICICIFGSVARGEARESSDTDLLIVLPSTQAIDRSLYRAWDDRVLQFLGEKYSPQFVHFPKLGDASSLWLEVALAAEILFDPSGELQKTVVGLRGKIAAGNYLRRESHGHPYWVRGE